MGASYRAVLWNRQKRIYDLILAGFVVCFLLFFAMITLMVNPEVTQETLIIRSTSTLAFLLLHVILCIGPLARINSVFLPLLYNRRHLGVCMFFIGAVHGFFSVIQFHALGNINPILSIFLSNTHYTSLVKFPFEIFGVIGLIIFFLMAITSHDFWLHNLGPRVWKSIHMSVYVAYASIILHVLLGVLQYEISPVLAGTLAIGCCTVIGLHLAAGKRERTKDNEFNPTDQNFVKVCSVHDIPNNRAKVVVSKKERIAIFKYDKKLSAVSNVCKHQNGPLGEGKIVDGCITCPWHGYQYLPKNGSSPPPFHEKVATYDLKIIGEEVWVNPHPYPEGTERPPVEIKESVNDVRSDPDEFYVGYLPKASKNIGSSVRKVVLLITIVMIGAAIVTAFEQKKFSRADFESGFVTELEGSLFTKPVPHLLIYLGKDIEQKDVYQAVLLVGFGKAGADKFIDSQRASIKKTEGEKVRLTGSLIYGDGKALLQVDETSDLKYLEGKATRSPQAVNESERISLSGEIVDPKCYFGVMKPGEGKTHRSCAIRCIAGGIPPVFKTDSSGYFLLVNQNNEAFSTEIANIIGDHVTLTGTTVHLNDWKLLQINTEIISKISANKKWKQKVMDFNKGITSCE